MREPIPDTAVFPMAVCERCGKAALTYLTLDASGGEARCCAHCDGPVSGELRWVSADELEAEGYYIGTPPPRSEGGCGGGCSCSAKKN